MADEEQGVVDAIFPAPPPFFKSFTTENLKRLEEFKDRKSKLPDPVEGADPTATLSKLPEELGHLIPPEPPADGKYTTLGMFIDVNEVLPSLKQQGLEQLYPSPSSSPTGSKASSEWSLDRAGILTKISRSILLNFLELIGILSINPEEYETKAQHIAILFVNAHALINEYRPHQARETLILNMEEQLKRKREEVDSIFKMKKHLETVLRDIVSDAQKPDDDIKVAEIEFNTAEEEMRGRQMAAWEALNEEWD